MYLIRIYSFRLQIADEIKIKSLMDSNLYFRAYQENESYEDQTLDYLELEIGKHQYSGNITIEVYPILTFRALCYKIEYVSQMPPEPHGIYLTVTTSDKGVNKLQGINWFPAATNTWQGVITEDWPYNNIPQKLSGNFKQSFTNYFPIKLREDVWKYLEGESDFDSCIAQERYNNIFGQIHCDSIFHLSMESNPLEVLDQTNICESSEDHFNATKELAKMVQKCLMQSDFQQYSTVSNEMISYPLQTFHHLENMSLIEIEMLFSSNVQTVHEEVLILDGIGLLGSLGGSLGLFLGFSFFDYIAMFIDIFTRYIVRRGSEGASTPPEFQYSEK